jgi:hypothetical protein
MDFGLRSCRRRPSNGGVPSGAGYGRRRRKRHKRYKGIVAIEVNARHKPGGYFRPRAIL